MCCGRPSSGMHRTREGESVTIEKILITTVEPTFEGIVTALAAFVPDGALLGDFFPITLLSGDDELWFTIHAPRHLEVDTEARLLLEDPPASITWWTEVALPTWNPEPGLVVLQHLAEYLDGTVHDREGEPTA